MELHNRIEKLMELGPFNGSPTYIVLIDQPERIVAVADEMTIQLYAAGLTSTPFEQIGILDFADGSATIQVKGQPLQGHTLLKVE